MKVTKSAVSLGLLALAASASTLAIADEPGGYVGGNIGQSRATIDDARIARGLLGAGAAAVSIGDNNRDTGYKLFGGYQFNKNIALEGGYFDLGQFGFTATTLPPGTLNGSIRARGLNLDLVGTLPITEKFSAFGRLGLTYTDSRDSFSGTGAVQVTNPSPNKREASYKYGLGIQYAVTQALGLRAEVERYRINDAVGNRGDSDLIAVGLVYRFGGKTPAPAAHAVEPAPTPVAKVVEMAPVVAAAPPPAPPPAPARFEKVTLSSTEMLFAFDSAELRLPQAKLDQVAGILSSHREVNNIVITGYTDRLGSSAYNQKLSQRRAVAVKVYLESKGVDASQLRADGKGETNPVVACTKEKGPALIKCLEPNRRVDIEQITVERRVN